MKTRHFWYGAALVLVVVAGGCNRTGRFEVAGRLTCKGKPVPSTYVIFQPDEEGLRASRGLTDDDGHFKLTYSRTETGVVPGRHTVFLKYYVSNDEELHQIPPKASKELKAVIAKYGDPKTSPLHYEIPKDGPFIEIPLE
jgi:hypothetical protein